MPTLDERIAAIEARLGPVPLATPPITIGELANVPAPGSPIAAQWAQDVSSRVVQRFPDIAAIVAQWPGAPIGALAVATGTGVLYRKIAAGWSQQSSWASRVQGTYQQPPSAAAVTTATLTIPADPGARAVYASAFVRIRLAGTCQGWVNLLIDGVLLAQGMVTQRFAAGVTQEYTLTVPGGMELPINRPVVVASQVQTDAGFGLECFVDHYRNRLDVNTAPRGF